MEKLKKEKIISIDLDDCLIPWDNSVFIETEEEKKEYYEKIKIETFKNLHALAFFSLMTFGHKKILIHSSWGMTWDKLTDFLNEDDIYEKDFFENIKKFIEFNFDIIDIDRKSDRKLFLEKMKEKYFIIALDDMNLSDLNDEHFIYIPTYGKIKLLNMFKAIEKMERN